LEKTLDEFNNQASGYLGKRSYCRECQNKSHEDYRKSDHGKQVRNAWKKTEKGKENERRYRLNPETIRKVMSYHRSEEYRARRRNRADNDRFGGNRKIVLDRDGHKCILCGSNHQIQVHHKDEMGRNKPKEIQNNDINNLVTLCAKCHIKQHNPVLKRWAAK
jgi:5-methylcytosine-specific restriction endonuclease McrA